PNNPNNPSSNQTPVQLENGTPNTAQTSAPGTAPGTTPGTSTNTMTAMNSTTSVQLFNSLDASHKGYLSTADVASNKFLATNFQKCDSNGDGRLTQAETTLCMQSMPAGEQ